MDFVCRLTGIAGFVVWLTWILATLARSPRPFAFGGDVELHGSVSKQGVVGTPRYRGLQRNPGPPYEGSQVEPCSVRTSILGPCILVYGYFSAACTQYCSVI